MLFQVLLSVHHYLSCIFFLELSQVSIGVLVTSLTNQLLEESNLPELKPKCCCKGYKKPINNYDHVVVKLSLLKLNKRSHLLLFIMVQNGIFIEQNKTQQFNNKSGGCGSVGSKSR